MARIEWVNQRLKNWALWCERSAGGGLGFSSVTSFLHDFDSSRYREARIPVDDVEASVTNEAVESLKVDRVHLYETLHCIYPQGLGIKETARRAGRAESTIKAQLEQADHVLKLWFDERQRLQRQARQTMEAVQQAARP